MSNKSTENHKNWVDRPLIDNIFSIIRTNIPTQNGFSSIPNNIKIKNTGLNINPSDLGCPEIDWFYWKEKYDLELVKESSKEEKLGLKTWNIIQLFEYAIKKGQIEKINNWVKELEFESSQIKEKETFKPYIGFLKDTLFTLKKHSENNKHKEILP